MKAPGLFLVFLMAGLPGLGLSPAWAQPTYQEPLAQRDVYNTAQVRTISVTPLFQRWYVGELEPVSQFSNLIQLKHRLSRNANLAVTTSQMYVASEDANLGGFADAQLAFSYRAFEPDLALNVGLSLPTGRTGLARDQFETATLIGNSIFGFQLPSVGQGLNLNVGVTWARPLSEDWVVGLGLSYQVRSSFDPLEDLTYTPGNEILLLGGIHYRLDETTAVAADLLFTTHGADEIDGLRFIERSNRVSLHVRLNKYFNFDELLLFARARYRSRLNVSTSFPGFQTIDPDKVDPNAFEAGARYRLRYTRRLAVAFQIDGRVYGSSTLRFSEARILGASLRPELLLGDVVIPLTLRLQRGSLFYRPLFERESAFNFELGIGITARL